MMTVCFLSCSDPWLLSCYQQRNAAQAQGHSRSLSDAAGQPARQQAARRPRTRWCGGVWGPGRGGAGLPPPSARSLLAAVNADALLDQRRPPHAGKPEPPRLGSRRRSQGRLYNFKGLWAGPLN